MAITKHQLIFDPSDNESDVVGAYLRSADGTAITHTTNGSKESLDVHIAGSDISIDVALDHTEDSVRLGDGTTFFTSTSENGDVALDVHLSNTEIAVIQGSDSPWAVEATDLDIRDLSAAQDNVAISDGTDTLGINADGSLNITDNGGSLTVDAVDFDIRDLSASQDSVSIGDGTDTLAVNTDGSLNTKTQAQGKDSCNYAAVSVGNTATDLVATELTSRSSILVQNLGNQDIYLGCDASVTTANGVKVPKGATADFPFGAGINVHAITSSGTADVRLIELAE